MAMKPTYETFMIITPQLQPADYETIIAKFNKILTDNGATITHQEVWGLKKLAYDIQRKSSGYYVLTEFETENQALNAKMDQEYGYDERIMRHLIVKLDKDAFEWAQKRRTNLSIKTVAPVTR
jgi:small subunit ribosomal protein S6